MFNNKLISILCAIAFFGSVQCGYFDPRPGQVEIDISKSNVIVGPAQSIHLINEDKILEVLNIEKTERSPLTSKAFTVDEGAKSIPPIYLKEGKNDASNKSHYYLGLLVKDDEKYKLFFQKKDGKDAYTFTIILLTPEYLESFIAHQTSITLDDYTARWDSVNLTYKLEKNSQDRAT